MEFDLSCAPFRQMIEQNPELRELRAHWATASPEKRQRAADYTYHAGIAGELFSAAAREPERAPAGASAVAALAIDADFAPALLTVGSLEYQFHRHEEAMACFLHLTELPPVTEDIFVIIDKAGSFLLDVPDLSRALQLYTAADRAFPGQAVFISAIGYCAAKQGDTVTALARAREAAALAPHDAVMLADLGWALVEANESTEAVAVLRRAITLAPGETMAEANLKELERRMHGRAD